MTWLWAVLQSKLGRVGVLVLAALAGLGLAYRRGSNAADDRHEREALENEVEAHDRINHAQTGDTLDDAGRRQWLRKYGSNDYTDR